VVQIDCAGMGLVEARRRRCADDAGPPPRRGSCRWLPRSAGGTSRCGRRRRENQRCPPGLRQCPSRSRSFHQPEDLVAVRRPVARLLERISAAAADQVRRAMTGLAGSKTTSSKSRVRISPGFAISTDRERPACDEHVSAGQILAADPADPLPGGDHAPRVADEEADVEASDVDPQLEGACGDDALERPLEQPPLDRAPPPRAGSRSGRRSPAPGSAAPAWSSHECRSSDLARLREGDRPEPLVERQPGASWRRCRDSSSVEEDQVAGRARRAAPLDDRERAAHERLAQAPGLATVADEAMKRGRRPRRSMTRCSRSRIWWRCDPKIPR